MASDSQYVLYDIPTKDPVRCWSWNVWKSRFVLNFKGLDYVTEWVSKSNSSIIQKVTMAMGHVLTLMW